MNTYAIKWDEKILVTQQNKNYLVWYRFIQEEISEKELLKVEYRKIKTQIVEVKAEIQEIEDTYDTYNAAGKTVADKQKTILSDRLSALRGQKDELVMSAIEKYGDEVLNEL